VAVKLCHSLQSINQVAQKNRLDISLVVVGRVIAVKQRKLAVSISSHSPQSVSTEVRTATLTRMKAMERHLVPHAKYSNSASIIEKPG